MSRRETQSKPGRRALLVAAATLTMLAGTTAVASTFHGGAPSAGATPSAGASPSAADVGRPRGFAASPLAKLDANSAAAPEHGTVAERIAAGPYSYLRIASAGAPDAWIATLGEGAPVGARVAIRSFGARRDFVSRRLGRTFARVDFALVSLNQEEEAR